MQAYAEGFEIMHASDYDLDLAAISELWMQGSVVRSWLLELAGRAFRANGPDLEHLKGYVADSGEGRWTVQEAIDHDVPAPGHHAVAADPVPVPPGRLVRGQGAGRAAQRVRWPRGQDRVAWPSRSRATRRPPRRRRSAEPATPGRSGRARQADARMRRPAPAKDKDAPLTMKDLRLARQGKRPSRAKPAENVLREGLRLERVPDPSVVVLFGATGDLAHRKVIPAIYQLWRTNLLPHEFILLGHRPAAVRRRRRYRAEIRASLETYSRVLPLDEAAWASFAERIIYHQFDFHDPGGFEGLASHLETDRQGARDPREPPVLPRHPAVAVRRHHRRARAGRARSRAARRRLAPGRHREAVRPRPRVGEAAEPRGRQGLPRVAGLPHRPLPGQGDGPEPAGLPVRQRDLRAALESALRGPRPDHRGGVDRHRESRLLLRADRRRRATSSRTTSSSWSASSRWSRRRRSRPTRCATRRSRSCGRSRRSRSTRSTAASSAASTVPAGSRPPRSPATARKRKWTRRRRPRRSSRPSSRSTTGAGPASRSTSGPASGSRSGRPRSRSSTARSPTACSRTRASSPTPTCSRSGSSRTRGSCSASGPRCPGLGLDVRSVTMDFTYGSAFNVDSPDAYETLILDALQGDASLFTRADEVEEAWAHRRPDRRVVGGRAAARVPELRRRDLGPAGLRRAAGPRRPPLATVLGVSSDGHRRTAAHPGSRSCAGRRGRTASPTSSGS